MLVDISNQINNQRRLLQQNIVILNVRFNNIDGVKNYLGGYSLEELGEYMEG